MLYRYTLYTCAHYINVYIQIHIYLCIHTYIQNIYIRISLKYFTKSKTVLQCMIVFKTLDKASVLFLWS